jgi:hypothetical protein
MLQDLHVAAALSVGAFDSGGKRRCSIPSLIKTRFCAGIRSRQSLQGVAAPGMLARLRYYSSTARFAGTSPAVSAFNRRACPVDQGSHPPVKNPTKGRKFLAAVPEPKSTLRIILSVPVAFRFAAEERALTPRRRLAQS